jgi:hypothetical protein
VSYPNSTAAYSVYTKPVAPLTDVDLYFNNSTSITFTIRMLNTTTGTWYMFYGVPGGTNFATVPAGTYNVSIYPNGNSNPYTFNGFCSFTGTGYTVNWSGVVLPGPHACSHTINVAYY